MNSKNPELIKLIRSLKTYSKKNNSRIWQDIAKYLSKPRQLRASVNISQLNRHIKKGKTAVVPGKVLGAGILDHPVTVAALSYSNRARTNAKPDRSNRRACLQSL